MAETAEQVQYRFIPGYAGNAEKEKARAIVNSVYPRLRGERGNDTAAICRVAGLSPATRGTPSTPPCFHCWTRFIPGYAGNAPAVVMVVIRNPVYPRLRGERPLRLSGHVTVAGLSPATRGTPATGRPWRWPFRFIPGYAGNARVMPMPILWPTVYPRLRGERDPVGCFSGCGSGLSPATRGTHRSNSTAISSARFIPGYAGNAFEPLKPPLFNSVYPRLRGERALRRRPGRRANGLSPATRGTRKILGPAIRRSRFIPGYAGNAAEKMKNTELQAVYPRLRGERRRCRCPSMCRCGLSPATRGTLMAGQNGAFGTRFIPGYAGNAKPGGFLA
mgnify:CR=1 FL=1